MYGKERLITCSGGANYVAKGLKPHILAKPPNVTSCFMKPSMNYHKH